MTLRFNKKPDFSTLRIVGSRVELVPISQRYKNAIFHEFTDEVTTYMVPIAPKLIEETEVFIENAIADMQLGTDVVCVVRRVHSHEFLGCCGLHGKRNPLGPEFGIWLKRSAQNQGLGRDVIRAMGVWGARSLDLHQFIYPADQANTPSCKLAESFGGEIIEIAPTRRMNGEWLNTVFYRIPKDVFSLSKSEA